MKTSLRSIVVFMLSIALFSCSGSHFLKDESYREQVAQDFAKKRLALPQGELFTIFDSGQLSVPEREALMFLYAYMPIGDVTDYSGEYYLENIRLSEKARLEMAWGKEIPDDIFRHFVLPIRVNNENLDDSRRVFYEELKDRVKGLSMKEAILEVNHWCHEKVVYRPSDARTSSPLASMKTAYGRCGEESTFTVAALRSVGIPARQVYTPRWAHTDDNHAWVEAWADGKWYFFGACEPEPVLNLGWFNAPASRGMLMHTKVFGRYSGPEEVMLQTPNYTEINVIDNYAPTAQATVMVTDENGQPVEGAKVEFKIYNYAEFYTVATKYTDAGGQAFLTAGKGDMLVWVSKDGRFGYAKLSFGKENKLSVVMDKKEGETYSLPLDIIPPAEGANLPEVTTEQRAENDRRLAKEDSIRNAYVATMMTEEKAKQWAGKWKTEGKDSSSVIKYLLASRGNWQTLIDFYTFAAGEQGISRANELLEHLTQKDLRDISLPVLKDHYQAGLSNPRIANEMLTPYSSFFFKALPHDGEEAKAFKQTPEKLVAWCRENIKIDNENNSQHISISPEGVWKARVADAHSRDIFFVALAKSLGINAWIDEVTGKVMYTHEGNTFDVLFEESTPQIPAKGILKATYRAVPSLEDPKYYSHFTISRFDKGTFRLLSYNEGDIDMGGGTTWKNLLEKGTALDAGYYMMVTGTRLASGGVLSNVTFFTVEPGKTTTIELVMRESKDQVQVIGNFNSESLYCPVDGKTDTSSASCGITTVAGDEGATMQSLLQTCGRGYFIVGVLGVGQEPTNHALRDIAALGNEFEKWGRKIVLLFPSEEQYKKFRSSEFPGLPSTIAYGIDVDNSIQKQIAGSMKLPNKTVLPMFIIADTFNRVVFVSQGYTIGLGEQLMKVIHGL